MRHSDVLLRVAPVVAAILFVRRRAAHLTASAAIANAAVSLHPGVRRLCVTATNVAFKIWPLEPFYAEASSDGVPYRLPSSQMAIVMSKRVDERCIAALFDRGRDRSEAPVSLDVQASRRSVAAASQKVGSTRNLSLGLEFRGAVSETQ
jgi:hypothetical protein